ncbi:EAL domain-containing protein [Methylobrevis pamukkalensis]|uniref:cyclic-guanylate-specific phosphodiesterase n=1 Tax=Methylobrevis pamukkalensis TaxID=1439726 RepID=A0A1E3GYL5_9HYPH|nr:EAL domain-containing protein [Methylobrevis pamukkalensis]ODN69015.1 putative membrane protein YjcC [Methylobrevis pamukkalensis]
MISPKFLRWIRVIAPAIAVVTVPMLISEYVLSHHAVANGRAALRDMAVAYVERADEMIGEAITVMKKLKLANADTCSLENRQAFGHAAFNSSFTRQIGLASNEGVLLCGEPMGSLASPARLPATTSGDASIMLSVLSGETGGSQLAVTLRVSNDMRLVARLDRQAIEMRAGDPNLFAATAITVHLDDGSLWWQRDVAAGPAASGDVIAEKARSSTLPVLVTVTASSAAMQASVRELRDIAMIGSIFFGVITLLVGMWISLQNNDGSDEFSRAVAAQEFYPYYQPVIDLTTGKVAGCEVLVRWIRDDGSIVPPGAFLPYAEATGLIREITRQLMAKTVDEVAALYERHPDFKLSINLTASHFDNTDIISEIRETYLGSGIDFRQLVFEVTEQHPLRDLELSHQIIKEIQAMGAAMALDDAGTGHGGLAYLQKLGFDIIKIDKMFIDRVCFDVTSETIVHSLYDIADRLGLKMIAEGVDSEDQIAYLRGLGVTYAQGFIFAKPLPAADFIAYVEKMADATVDEFLPSAMARAAA